MGLAKLRKTAIHQISQEYLLVVCIFLDNFLSKSLKMNGILDNKILYFFLILFLTIR